MKLENVNILQCKFGLKIISAKYYNNVFGQNRSVEEEEFPHPDLINARDDLQEDLAKAFYIETEEREQFKVVGFNVDEGDGVTTVNIHGQMTNPYEYVTNVKSGKITLDEDQEDLKIKLDTLKVELFKFFFEEKTAQGKLPGFEGEPKQDDTETPNEEPEMADVSGNGEEA